MIEKMNPKTTDTLIDFFLDGVSQLEPEIIEEHQSASRKFFLSHLRKIGKEVNEISDELVEQYRQTYQEIEALSDEEFEILRSEIQTLEVADLSLVT